MESLGKSQGQNPRGNKNFNKYMIYPRLFQTFSLFCHPGLVKRDFFFNGVPRYTTGKWRGHEAPPLVELNPYLLGRDVERMKIMRPTVALGFNYEHIPVLPRGSLTVLNPDFT